jgi:hypothetical protein
MEQDKIQSKKKSVYLVFICMIALFVVAGAIFCWYWFGKKNNNKRLVNNDNVLISVGNDKFSLADIMYYIFSEEEIGAYYDSIFQANDMGSYWNSPDEEQDNKTGEELAKESILESVKQDSVLYQEAIKAGYSLSDNEKKDAKNNYDDFIADLSEKQKKISGMGEELQRYFEREIILNRYKDDIINSSGFDYDKAIASISKDDYREYDFECFLVYNTDDNDDPYSQEKMTSILNRLNELKSQITADNDMESLITEEDDEYLDFSDECIVENDGEDFGTYKGVDIDAAIKSMENGQVSEVFELEYGYMVVRMNDNNSSTAYDEACDEVMSNGEKKAIEDKYKEVESLYKISVSDKWDEIVIGHIVYEENSDSSKVVDMPDDEDTIDE